MIPKLTEVAAIVRNLPDDLVEAATARFDEIARETAARAVGGTMTLHGRGGKRWPVELKTNSVVVGHGANAIAIVHGTPTAMWLWISNGTAPHLIGKPRARPVARTFKTIYLYGAGYEHPVAGPIMHGGSRGKGTWTTVVNTFRKEYPQLLVRTKQEAFRHAG